MNKCGIYIIQNTLTGDCYFGQSVRPTSRLGGHRRALCRSTHENIFLQRAVNKYGIDNFTFSVILYCERFELTYYEQKCVDTFESSYNLCRECVTTRTGVPHSADAKHKISIAISGKIRSDEQRHNISIAHIGIHQSDSTKHKISVANLGKRRSEEARHNIALAASNRHISDSARASARHNRSLAQKGKTMSLHFRQVMSQLMTGNKYNYGKKWSDEHRAAMIDIIANRSLSDDARRRMSEATAGKKKSEETRRKMSLAAKRRYSRGAL